MIEFNPYEKGTVAGDFTRIFFELPESPSFPSKETQRIHITKREREVLQWLQQGKSSWEISTILGLSERTVNFHVYNLMEKIGAVNRPQMIILSLRLGLINLE